MADNLTTTATVSTVPVSTVIATDDVAGVHYQYVKLVDGTLDGTTKSVIGANGLEVNVKALPALAAGSAVIGHVILDTTSTTAVTQATGTNLHTVVDSGTVTTVGAVTAITNALPAGTNVIGHVIPDVSTTQALTGAAPATASVGITSASAVAANASRRGMVLVNVSSSDISLGIGANAAVLNSGITLRANGGSWVMDQFTYTVGAINAIAQVASSTLSIQEFT